MLSIKKRLQDDNIETKHFKVSQSEAEDFISQLNHDIQFPQIQGSGTTTIIPAKSIVEVRIEEDESSVSKAKGRKLQTWVVEKLLNVFKRLTPLDVRSTPMGVNGVDVQLSTSAYRQFPYNIECKNTERIRTLYNYYEQAISHDHIEQDGEPLLIIKMNRQKPLVVVDAEHFIDLVVCQNKK